MKTFYKISLSFILLCFVILGCKNQNKSEKQQVTEKTKPEGKYSHLSNEELLDTVQYQTFNYFWGGAEPNSGLARERFHMDDVYPTSPKNTVTTGGSGFGLMAILVGIERGFVPKEEALDRYIKIVDFLEKADRFHGAWPHWINGETGKVVPFGKKDNGGDLVETAFLIQGLLTVSEYFQEDNIKENELREKIDKLWREVEWDWYTKNGEDVLYWHWSPEYNWEMNFPVGGYNECLIMYVLAASSPTHSVNKSVYEKGWARGGDIVSEDKYYDEELVLDYFEHSDDPIGPLFWAHYSYLGLNPQGLSDQYADYWKLTQNHAKIHHKYAINNPKNYKGYGDSLWGLTSSYSIKGYAGHRPGEDLGVVSPTAALSSFPYTPKASMNVLENIYKNHDSLVGKYGPYDAFSLEDNWYLPRYLAIDQGPIPVMIENYRTGLLWNLFMKNKDVQAGLKKLDFKIERDK
ncbi:glucoamylase family protein [Winogradskyella sp. SYSU M77433]|uniref:glucoamylase family protein n=1 Tax=Winogradskyella sp. SYSU M77433 TaxID=3042722 RepID=UPI0024800918|nr:glucoamylase family protein [Winogradskyella sp. SYSU M77433]MDH7911602.1 glucoamylase family protein [Winogradskyella sp. SYSU M77433]